MKLLLYLLKIFLAVFLGAVFFVSFVLVLIDLLMNLWNYMSNTVPAKEVFHVMALYLPKTIWYAVPLAVLFASSYTISALYGNNELIAIFASGVSLFKFTLPILVLSVLLSIGLFFFEDKVVVPTFAQKESLQKTLLNINTNKNNDRIVILAEGGKLTYRSEYYDDENKRLYNTYFVFRDEGKKLDAVIYAQNAFWTEDIWKIQDATQYTVTANGEIAISRPKKEYTDRLTEPAETFRNNTISVEAVTTKEARAYIKHLERIGLPFDEELSVYYKKYSFSFVVLIAVLLSIGLSGKTRKNIMVTSIALSVGATVAFYVFQMVTMLLAKYGYISAFNGAWLPVVVFIALSIVLLRFAKT